MTVHQTLSAFWARNKKPRSPLKYDQSSERRVEEPSESSSVQDETVANAENDDGKQMTLRRKAKGTSSLGVKRKRSILPHDLSERWSTSRSAPSISTHGDAKGTKATGPTATITAFAGGRHRLISESDSEFITPIPMRKRATVGAEWRTPVITPEKKSTMTGPRKKRNMFAQESFIFDRPRCWGPKKG